MDKEITRKKLNFSSNKKYILFGGAFDNLRKNYPLLKQAVDCQANSQNIVCMEMKGLTRHQCTMYMNACDVFALPTKSEGSPQALKEAMACNCPIIATDVADIKYLLGSLPGHYICSFNSKDVAVKLSQALSFNGKTKGRDRIFELHLTNEQVAKRVYDVYYKVLNERRLITPPTPIISCISEYCVLFNLRLQCA